MYNYGFLQGRKYPGPETLIEVISPSPRKSLFKVNAIIDSGAVKTCLPMKTITGYAGNYKLPYRTREVTTATGRKEEARSYFVDLKVSGYLFHNIEVLALNREYALLGRDILNTLVLTLDGINLAWEMRR